jgi:hypothetical protein
MDHDQRFKILIKEFFEMFLRLFFRAWADRLDCSAVEWLDKEVFPDPPQGPRRVLDLVGRVRTRQTVPGQHSGEEESWLALVHIEIESPDKAAPLRPRMYRSYNHLRQMYGQPVLPIAIFLQVGLDGVGIDVYEESFWELETIRFKYLYVGLPALDAVKYVEGDNWLGVALSALMKIPADRAAWLGAEALRKIQGAPLTDQQRFLLGECVQAYLPLDERQQAEFEKLLGTEPYKGVPSMNTTWYEKGIEEGRRMNATSYEKGIEQGRRETLREQLEDRFGPLSAEVTEKIQRLSPEGLTALAKKVLHAAALRDLGLED